MVQKKLGKSDFSKETKKKEGTETKEDANSDYTVVVRMNPCGSG